MVGEVDDRRAVGGRRVVEGECARGVEGVRHGDVERSGEPHVAVGAVQGQPHDRGVVAGVTGGLPHSGVEALGAAVQCVAAVVGGDLVGGAVEGEAAVGDAVGEAADESAEEGVLPHVVVERGQGPDDRSGGSVGVGHGEAVQDAAVGEDLGLDSRTGVECPDIDVGAAVGSAERLVVHGGARHRRSFFGEPGDGRRTRRFQGQAPDGPRGCPACGPGLIGRTGPSQGPDCSAGGRITVDSRTMSR